MAPSRIDGTRVPSAFVTPQGAQERRKTTAAPAPAPRSAVNTSRPSSPARTSRNVDSFEAAQVPPDAVRLNGRLVTPAQREAGRRAMVEGFTALAQRVATAHPPLSRQQVLDEAGALRGKFFEVGFKQPADSTAGNGLYQALTTMSRARQLLAEDEPGSVDRARVMLNLTPHEASYAARPDVQEFMASKKGSKENLDLANQSGAVLEGELGGLYRAWKSVGDLTSATPTPEQQAFRMLDQLDSITAWADSKEGITASGYYDASVVQMAAKHGAELRRVLALDDSAALVPAKEEQVRQALQNAKSSVLDALPPGQSPAKALDARREAAFSNGDKWADAVSLLPGKGGAVAGFLLKEIGVGLRLASGDMNAGEAALRTASNALDVFLKNEFIGKKLPGSGLVKDAFIAAGKKFVLTAGPDLFAIHQNSKTNGMTDAQYREAMTRAVTKAMVESFKEAVTTSINGIKELRLDTEQQRAAFDVVIGVVDKIGLSDVLKPHIDGLLNVPTPRPEPK